MRLKRCHVCDELLPHCVCHRADVWVRLARLPVSQQWFVIGIVYLVLVALFLFAASANAQGAVPRTSAQLSFTAPAKNTDGTDIPSSCAAGVTQCGKLALHRIEYGTCNAAAFGTKQGEITVAMPATTATVANLVVQVYCFRAIARNDYGIESEPSNVTTKTIDPPKPGAPLLAVSSTAYEIRQNAKGVLVAHRVGVIPRGTECVSDDSLTIGSVEYHRVSREAIDLVNWPDEDPLVDIWALCG